MCVVGRVVGGDEFYVGVGVVVVVWKESFGW